MAEVSLSARLKMAWRLLVDPAFAAEVEAGQRCLEAGKAAPPPELPHASSLQLLAALQREGRLIDFLQQDVAGFPDEEIGAAARVVHAGCRKVLLQSLDLEAIAAGAEGSPMTVPVGFDAQRIRLTGNVTGHPPFTGTLRHHGWLATSLRFPAVSGALDPRVIAPAEVELP